MIKYAEQFSGGRVKALFGGSFNPVHIGHLITARDILEDFQFEKIIFVPAFVQPLKETLLIPPEIRLQILKASIESEHYFDIWDYEIKKGGISYTFQTLETYKKLHKEKPAFIMGSDSFHSFHKWKEPEKILQLSQIIIVQRPGHEITIKEILQKVSCTTVAKVQKGNLNKTARQAEIILYEGRKLEISSTEIRQRLKEGKSIKYMVTEKAEKILRRWWENALQQNV